MDTSIIWLFVWRKFGVFCQFCWLQVAQKFCNRHVFYIEEVYVLGNLFFKDEAWFHLNGYIDNENHRTRSAENPHACIQILCFWQWLELDLQCLEKKNWRFFLRDNYCGILSKCLAQFIVLLDEKQKRNAGSSKMGIKPTLWKKLKIAFLQYVELGIWSPRSAGLAPW